jgi:hypothetical protein
MQPFAVFFSGRFQIAWLELKESRFAAGQHRNQFL